MSIQGAVLRSLTPGPSPFSATKITPAVSNARLIAASFAGVMPSSPWASSALRTVDMPIAAALATLRRGFRSAVPVGRGGPFRPRSSASAGRSRRSRPAGPWRRGHHDDEPPFPSRRLGPAADPACGAGGLRLRSPGEDRHRPAELGDRRPFRRGCDPPAGADAAATGARAPLRPGADRGRGRALG